MATPLKVEDLPLLQMTLTTKEILQLCRPWLDYQQNMLLFEKQLMLPIREEAIRARLPAVLTACRRHEAQWSYRLYRAVEYVTALDTLTANALLGTPCPNTAYQELRDEIAHMTEGLMRRVPVEFEDRTWVRLAEKAVCAMAAPSAGVVMLEDRERCTLMVLDAWLRV